MPIHEDDFVGLSDTIQCLRNELAHAMHDGAKSRVKFELGPIELELQVAVSREKKGEGGVQFWVLNAGAAGSVNQSVLQTLKLTLTPVVDGVPGPTKISDPRTQAP